MKNNMFASLIEKPQATRKWLLFPLSLLIHGVVIASVLVAPLLSDSAVMPELKIVTVALIAAPQPPPLQTAAKSKRGHRKEADKKNPEPASKPVSPITLIAPQKIPIAIIPEDIGDFGDPDGSDNGVIGGVPEGMDGGVVGAPTLINRDRSGMNDSATPSHVTPPRLIKKIMPLYPETAQKSHVQGNVILEAVTDISGRVAKVRIITGHLLLRAAAEQAVRQWVYEPYIINGYPKPVIFTVTVSFHLNR